MSEPPTPAVPVVGADATPTPAEVTKRGSRAGRNLPQAIGVGLALAAVVLGSLLIHKNWFGYVIAAAMVVGAWEMRQAFAHRGFNAPLVPVALGAVAMILAALESGAQALVVVFGLTVAAVILWRALDGIQGAAADIAAGVLCVLYPCFLGGFAALLLAPDDGVARTVVFVLTTVCSDVGGYAAGVLFGKHPMAPRLSPKKSWEGFGGSVLACALSGALTVALLLGGAWWGGALLGVAMAVCATVGDLMESSIKRDLGIKDMSNLLPGHGGLMDRLDSLVMTVPICWVALLVLAPLP